MSKRRCPSEGQYFITIKGQRFGYPSRDAALEARKEYQREYQRIYQKRQHEINPGARREYQSKYRETYKGVRKIPPVEPSEEANNRDRYEAASMPHRCFCGRWTTSRTSKGRCVFCWTQPNPGITREEHLDIKSPPLTNDTRSAWSVTEFMMGNFLMGMINVDIFMEYYIPPPLLRSEEPDDD